MVYNKATDPNKVIFSYFDILPFVKYHSKYKNFKNYLIFIGKLKIAKYDFVRSYDFVIYHDATQLFLTIPYFIY